MIRFRAYKNDQPLSSIELKGAHLFAQDEIPVRSQLEFTDGEIIGVRHNDTAVGLVSMWQVPEYGKVLLQTTRLPERNEPYNLNLELARGRLLRIMQKREEWQFANIPLAETQTDMLDEASEFFIQALSHLEEPVLAAKYADQSLSLSVRAGEEISVMHGKLFLERRAATQGFGRHTFGGVLDPRRIHDEKYLHYIKNSFNFVTIPLNWKDIEPKEQQQNFELLDACVDWLCHHRIAVKVGPLISFRPYALPDWLFIWENDFEQVREMAYEFITAVVERYGAKVQAWDVVSGLNGDNCFKFSFDQIIEITRSASLAAKQANHRALVLVEITDPWGEYYALNQRSIPPLIYANVVSQSGVKFDGFALRMRFGRGGGGMQTRDFLELSHLLDKFGAIGKTIHLSGVQVPSIADSRDNSANLGHAGTWRGEWSEESQAQWLDEMYQLALGRPFVESIHWQDLVDCGNDGVLQNGGLLRADMTEKPAYERLMQLKKQLVRKRHK